MKDQFLKLAGVKSEKEFYKLFPDEATFMAKYGKQVKKLNLGGAMAAMNKLAGSNAFATGVQSLGDVVGGIQQMKDEKQQMLGAQQMQGVSNVALQASMTKPEQVKRQYLRPPVNTGEEFFPIYGTGTNVLSAKNGGEIANTFAPNTIYTDLEEAFDGIKLPEFKTFPDFLKNPMKQGTGKEVSDIYDFAQKGGGDALAQMTGGLGSPKGYGVSGGGKVGKGIGTAAGSIFFGPVGGMVGGAIGQLAGNLLDQKAEKTEKAKKATDRNMDLMAMNQGAQSLQQQNYSYMKQGGFVNPQVATSLEGIPLTRLFAPDPTMDTLRTGGNIRQNNITAMDGNIKATWGGQLKPISYNPYQAGSGQTVLPLGNSHEQRDEQGRTGIGISVGNNQDNHPMMDYAEYGTKAAMDNTDVEVENKEPMIEQVNSDGGKSVVVHGNQKLTRETAKIMGDPKLAGKKIKNVSLDIAMLENKIGKNMSKTSEFLSELNANNPYDKLTQSGLQAAFMGYDIKLQKLADDKGKLTAIQETFNNLDEKGIDYKELIDNGKVVKKTNQAKNGAKITTAQKGITKEQQSEGERLYKSGDIKGFQEYVQKVAPWMVDEIIKERGMPKISKRWADGLGGPRTEDAFQRFVDPSMLNTAYAQPSGKSITDIQAQIASQMSGLEPMYTEEYTGTYPERPIADRNKNWLLNAFNQIRPYLIPSNAESLDPSQISGELMALADNDLRPVRVQTVQSQLASPYKVSFQDMINEITAGERAATRLAGYNPAAQSIIAAAAAREKSGIRGRELAENLRLENEIYNRNRDVLNADRMKNLELYDQQFVRQEQALANTKAVKQAAVNSINAKILQNRLANRQAGIAENMYNYRFDKQGRAINVNPLMAFNTEMDIPVYDNEGNVVEYKRQTKEKYDKSGLPAGKEITTQTRQKPTTAKNGTLVKAVK